MRSRSIGTWSLAAALCGSPALAQTGAGTSDPRAGGAGSGTMAPGAGASPAPRPSQGAGAAAPGAAPLGAEASIVVLADQPAMALERGREHFVRREARAAAADLERAAAFVRLEASRAEGEARRGLDAAARDLDGLARSVGRGTMKSVDELDSALANAAHALARHHYLQAERHWTNKQADAGRRARAARGRAGARSRGSLDRARPRARRADRRRRRDEGLGAAHRVGGRRAARRGHCDPIARQRDRSPRGGGHARGRAAAAGPAGAVALTSAARLSARPAAGPPPRAAAGSRRG